jgi:hypothetical protein
MTFWQIVALIVLVPIALDLLFILIATVALPLVDWLLRRGRGIGPDLSSRWLR